MNDEIMKEITKILSDNLASAKMDLIVERLKRCDQLEDESKKLQEDIQNLLQEKSDQQHRLNKVSSSLSEIREETQELKSREKEIYKKESELKLREALLGLKEQHASEKVSLMREVIEIPFRNRVLRESALVTKEDSIIDSRYNSETGYNENYEIGKQHNQYEETKTTEEQ